MVLFMPLCAFVGMFSYFFEKLKMEKIFLNPSGSDCNLLLFILYLPWNLVATIVMLSVCSILSLMAAPVVMWPAIFYNVRRYRRTMDYWSGKRRVHQQVLVDKIVFKPPPPRAAPYRPPNRPPNRPPYRPPYTNPYPDGIDRHPEDSFIRSRRSLIHEDVYYNDDALFESRNLF